MTATPRVTIGRLQVATVLRDLVEQRAAAGTGIAPAAFWSALERLVAELAPRLRQLLARRDELQGKIDAWHRARAGQPHDAAAYRKFLEEIGYLLPEGEDFKIETERVDPEVATIAGPQLVVPVNNARYALNAANARWGSLYDALYGTDAIAAKDGCEITAAYNPRRGAAVIAFARDFLDQAAPLAAGRHRDATTYSIQDGKLSVTLANKTSTGLALPVQLQGWSGETSAPEVVRRSNVSYWSLIAITTP